MIQRIQSFWWLLALVCAVVFIVLPTPFAISGTDGLFNQEFLPMLIATALAASFSYLAILGIYFIERKPGRSNNPARKLQITFGRLSSLAIVAIIGMGVYFAYFQVGNDIPFYAAILPVAALFFNFLGVRSTRKDISLIKSQDRLR